MTRPRVQQYLAAVAVAAVLAGALALRWAGARGIGFYDDAPFWAESAQHYRYTYLAANEGGIPQPDLKIEYPRPFDARGQTILGEQIAGLAAAPWGLTRVELFVFLRWYIRTLGALLVIPVYLLTRNLSAGRLGGILAALVWATAYAAVSSGVGDQFYHEHTSFVFLGFYLVFQARAIGSGKWRDIVAASLFLILALLSWKVVRFVHAQSALFFLIVFAWRGLNTAEGKTLAGQTGLLGVAGLLPGTWLSLGHDRFVLSISMLLSAAVTGAWLISRRMNRRAWRVALAVAALLLAAGAAWQIEDPGTYGHVWELFAARLTHFSKPADPSQLSFEVRHYWVPPYTTPDLLDFIEESAFTALLVLLPLGVIAVRAARRRAASGQLWQLFFASAALVQLAFFQKFAAWQVLTAAPFLGWIVSQPPRWLRGERRMALAGIILAGCAVQSIHAIYWRNSPLTAALMGVGIEEPEDRYSSRAATSRSLNQLLFWMAKNTPEDGAMLCEFPLAPVILAYTGRPTNLHAYFESDVREKYRRFSEALFASEETMYQLCLEWKTKYVIYNAHMLFRTDPAMSFRYVADKMAFDWDWVCAKFHFKQDELRHFDLMYQNEFFRVFRLLAPGEAKSGAGWEYQTLFDRALFEAHVPRDSAGNIQTGDWLVPFVRAYENFDVAFAAMREGRTEIALPALDAALADTPLIAEVHTLRGMVYNRLNRRIDAVNELSQALELNPRDERASILLHRIETERSP